MFGKKDTSKEDKLLQIRQEVINTINKNAPEYSDYTSDLIWKIKKFHDKGKRRIIGEIGGNTIYINENELNNPRIVHHFEHELAHYIDHELNGVLEDGNQHNDNFFDILEAITGTPERQKYKDGIYRGAK